MAFAPFAYGSLVWTADHHLLASVDNEGTSLWIRSTTQEREQLAASSDADIVPLAG